MQEYDYNLTPRNPLTQDAVCPTMKALNVIALVALLVRLPTDGFAQEVVATSADMPVNKSATEAEIEKVVGIALSLGPKASTPAQLVQLTRGLDSTTASTAFLRVSHEFLQQGQIDVAADVISQMIKEYPSEPASTEAGLLLLRIYSSGELAHTKLRAPDPTDDLHLPPGWQREQAGDGKSTDTQQAKQKSQDLLTYSRHLAGEFLQRNPELAKHPEFAFQLAVIGRSRIRSTEAKSWLTIVRNQREQLQWRRRARAETWLQDQPSTPPPVSVVRCGQSATAPHLDGLLDDDCWQYAAALTGSNQPTHLLLAFDERYLYLASRCAKFTGNSYETDSRPRTYDADLSSHDRVEISLDLDRDYESSYRLTVDHRGWTNDSCWLDRSWNPRWFVAARQDDGSWTFEAAIAWSELTRTPPQAGNAWVIGAKRSLGSTTLEEGADFQILIFE